ncbi:MAG: carboxyl transferase domain-containing protein [Smithellaceae bacterium]
MATGNKIEQDLKKALDTLIELNSNFSGRVTGDYHDELKKRPHRLQKVLVANRAEIAKRFFLTLHEEGIPSVAVVTDVDKEQSWYEFADEIVFIGDKHNYSNIPVIIAAAQLVGANAIYPGYGFLSESSEFVESLDIVSKLYGRKIIFMGPDHKTMKQVGNKLNARYLAHENNIPLFESSQVLSAENKSLAGKEAQRIGYPVIIKLASGGGGKGIYPVFREEELTRAVDSCCRIGRELYGDTSFYIEKYLIKPTHIEVQIFNGWAIGIRKCAVQRRNQKIIEESGHSFLDEALAKELLAAAEKIAKVSGYSHNGGAGTVEFLIDGETGKFGFMEVNTRLQVEYAVTDQSLGIDLAKWQILFFDGREKEIIGLNSLGTRFSKRDHSIECRIYAEDPENDYLPSPGVINEMDLPAFNGIRCDFGYGTGDNITPMYDPMIGKVIGNGATRKEALIRLDRALQELYISGVKTNINQLLRIVRHPEFIRGDYTNNLLQENPALNFRQVDADKTGTDNRNMRQIHFGGLAEHIRLLYQTVTEFLIVSNIDGIINTRVLKVPSRYTIEYSGKKYSMEYLQTSFNSFHIFAEGIYIGRAYLNTFNDRFDDLQIIFRNRSYRIRLDRQTSYISLRMKDEDGKINYHRLHIALEDTEEEDDAGVVYSPFQGNFVAFCRDDLKPGAEVKAGEPLIILSSMKMETTIHAPVDGKISYVVMNGDASVLQNSKMPDGSVMMKSFQEGEKLVIIERPKSSQERLQQEKHSIEREAFYPVSGDTLEVLMAPDFDKMVAGDSSRHIDVFMELLYALIQGFIEQPSIIEKIENTLNKISIETWSEQTKKEISGRINQIILQYIDIKKLFSPVVYDTGLSLPEELNRFIAQWHNPQLKLSSFFAAAITPLLKSYGISDIGSQKSKMHKMQLHLVFMLLKKSYGICLDHPDIIKALVHINVNIGSSPETFHALVKLLEHEQSGFDDSLSRYIKKVIEDNFPDHSLQSYPGAEGKKAALVNEQSEELLQHQCLKSLESPEKILVPPNCPQSFVNDLTSKLSGLEKRFKVQRLYSPVDDVFIYCLHEKENEHNHSYAAFACFQAEGADEESLAKLENIILRAATTVSSYQQVARGQENWVEILTNNCTVVWDTNAVDVSRFDYGKLIKVCSQALGFFNDRILARGILNLNVRYYSSEIPQRKQILYYQKGNAVILDLLFDSDRRNPYLIEEKFDAASQRLLDNDKWPIEFWAGECLDPGSACEIKIASIDDVNKPGSGDEKKTIRPVAAKIFYGTIEGREVCFYMKDSRISGGSTGKREGLKYMAAAYISYLKNWPLYVWNDSAGANIMEGVVSLNRGAEGFMMNTLLAENVDYQSFRFYTDNVVDPDLKKLFRELDREFDFTARHDSRAGKSLRFVAVGIGSSAGLDVYGSSQATIQLLIDSESSYRVLTGSNVIRSVMGEDISNYDIGGAKILGKWTGIVDIIADDKIQLLSHIRQLHRFFFHNESLAAIRRTQNGGRGDSENRGDHNLLVFTEATVRNNVDDGIFLTYKKDYYASEALIGGFVKVAGQRALVLGPRTHSGLRSAASIIKARELLKIARRTATHQIIIFGKKWQERPNYHENINMRDWLDFMETLQQNAGARIHIVTFGDGLKCFEINSGADAIIFIRDEGISPTALAFARRNSTFMVSSFAEAFDLSSKIIKMLYPLEKEYGFVPPRGTPSVPSDIAQPYDIIGSVIDPVFDSDSFVEFYKEMNNPLAGPSLVTGLATLGGRPVGIIADQPLYKGGGADAPGTEKFRVFTQFLNKHRIPLIMLSNSSGFVPGSKQERYRIQAIGAESLDANILGRIPVVSVVLKQNYGGRLIQAFNKYLRPGIVYLALESAVMAVIGVTAAFDVLNGSKYNQMVATGDIEKAREMKDDFYKKYLTKAKAGNDALATGLLDWTIPDEKDLRGHLIKALELAYKKCKDVFPEKPFC